MVRCVRIRAAVRLATMGSGYKKRSCWSGEKEYRAELTRLAMDLFGISVLFLVQVQVWALVWVSVGRGLRPIHCPSLYLRPTPCPGLGPGLRPGRSLRATPGQGRGQV